MDYFSTSQGGTALGTALMVFVVMILGYVIVQPIVDLVSTTRKSMWLVDVEDSTDGDSAA